MTRPTYLDDHTPEWVVAIVDAQDPPTATSLAGLATLLETGDDTPPALSELARRYRDLRHDVARLTRAAGENQPTARATDPDESHDAATIARGAARVPNGPVHKILARLALVDGWTRADEVGLTGRELAEGGGSYRRAGELDVGFDRPWDKIPGAWKRVTELARDGLIVQAIEVDGGVERYVKRDGSRVWIITDTGLAELRRLNDLRGRREVAQHLG